MRTWRVRGDLAARVRDTQRGTVEVDCERASEGLARIGERGRFTSALASASRILRGFKGLQGCNRRRLARDAVLNWLESASSASSTSKTVRLIGRARLIA